MKKMIMMIMIAIAASAFAFGQTKMSNDSKVEAQIIGLEKAAVTNKIGAAHNTTTKANLMMLGGLSGFRQKSVNEKCRTQIHYWPLAEKRGSIEASQTIRAAQSI
jgi:hypothetical protein